jgi:hypothetical protein
VIGHDFVEPDVGGLQCLVEDIKTGRAHGLASFFGLKSETRFLAAQL